MHIKTSTYKNPKNTDRNSDGNMTAIEKLGNCNNTLKNKNI